MCISSSILFLYAFIMFYFYIFVREYKFNHYTMTSEILKIELSTQLEIKQAEIFRLESDLNPLPFIQGILKTRRQEANNLKSQLKTL